MKQSTQFLISIIVILGATLVLVIAEYNELRLSNESQDGKYQVDEIIDAFKDRYSEQEIKEDLDSSGVPYRYTATTNYNSHVELLLAEERTILRQIGTPEGDTICVVINPHPRDVWDTCPSKW